MVHPFLRAAACLAASFALLGPAAAQGTGQTGATRGGDAGSTMPQSRHRGSMNEHRMPGHMRHGDTAASPSGTSATMPRDDRRADWSRDCAPTAAGPTTRPLTQDPAFRSEMSQCTSRADRDARAECVRELWASSGGTAACM
jgi:hypothetical protein